MTPRVSEEDLRPLPLNQRIRRIVKAYGPTQEQFAALIGTDRTRVNKWATGKSRVGTYAAAIAQLTELPEDLFDQAEAQREVEYAQLALLREIRERLDRLETEVAALRADQGGRGPT